MASKRIFYIFLFTVLGALLNFVIHGAIELPAVHFLKKDFVRYSLGLSWSDWFLIHHVFTAVLFVLGIGFGIWAGFHFWNTIYGTKK